ncbi:hypothetical protein BS47DRAFT_1335843 [Hydnum rufescens UP504]|uniref:NAD-dependent epimerase/dehydratase domain-containing protein n=1 Tax=Hydnum rufescens UP504 TaxID=1448309 RepID=A0A9P6BA98_9AGAM|nr:hypothetical protein BS47DRAFT_1335843 [Hydnum rufescens UP504]
MARRLFVVGGNGFLGSSVCRQAVSKGWEVTSISTSGRPFKTPRGHTPAWVSKSAIRSNAIGPLFGSLFEALTLSNSNPLKGNDSHGSSSYQLLNHDSALLVLEAYRAALSSEAASSLSPPIPRTFVYISAEDIFRPLVPRGYIDTKRAAERDIASVCTSDTPPFVRGLSIRPGLMYHPYFRPLTTPIATLLSLSSSVQRYITSSTGGMIPVPSSILRSISSVFSHSSFHGGELTPPSPLQSIANALEIPPLHVDQVAKAILLAITDTSDLNDEGRSPRHVLGVKEMVDLLARDAAEETGARGAGTTTIS